MRKSIYACLIGVAALVGFGSAWMPPPFESVGIYMIVIGLLVLIVSGHRAAFQTDDAGIFAFWSKPKKMAAAQADDADHWPLFLGLVAAFSPMLSIISRIIWLA